LSLYYTLFDYENVFLNFFLYKIFYLIIIESPGNRRKEKLHMKKNTRKKEKVNKDYIDFYARILANVSEIR
jgi:hypothetical protein